MLMKFTPSLLLDREKVEKSAEIVTKNQWVYADRVVMLGLLLLVVAGAIFFS